MMVLWNSAGPFARGIIIVLLLMSLWSLTVSITKLIMIKKSQTATKKFAPEFSRAIQEENLEKEIALAEKIQ
jgi:biopolymer transport protein ExbB/biopolymer transport protein TolQ